MARAQPIARYLERYAESAAMDLPLRDFSKPFRYVLTIPCFDEQPDFLTTLMQQAVDAEESILVILLVNAPEDAGVPQIEQTKRMLEPSSAMRELRAGMYLQNAPFGQILLVDRVSQPLPAGVAVGLARKIAADIALQLIHCGLVSCPFIFMTDADAQLPAGYFAAAERINQGTVLYPYKHHAHCPRLQSAADAYELHMRHYVEGLRDARSPYAFATIGSTIAVHAQAYAAVRGVPRRNAAEDFYLLNKLAKVAGMVCLKSPRIHLEARLSARVPFGTGRVLEKMPDPADTFASYPTEVFAQLAQVLEALDDYALNDTAIDLRSTAPLSILADLGWGKFEAMSAIHYRPGARRLRAVHEWFDGFRTMRLIRQLQRLQPEVSILDVSRRRWGQPNSSINSLIQRARSLDSQYPIGISAKLRNKLKED